jgi:hypothetical protein
VLLIHKVMFVVLALDDWDSGRSKFWLRRSVVWQCLLEDGIYNSLIDQEEEDTAECTLI